MALVNYDVSDDDEQSEDDTEIEQKIHEDHETMDKKSDDLMKNEKLFTKLPPPKSSALSQSLLTPSLNDIVVSKKSHGPIKIVAPSLKDYAIDDDDDDDNEERKRSKRFKSSGSGTALSSLLPKPKNDGALGLSRKLVPQSVARPKPNLPPPKLTQKKSSQSLPHIKKIIVEDEGEVESSGDFFFLNDYTKPDETVDINSQSIGNDEASDTIYKNVDIAPQFQEYDYHSSSVYGPVMGPLKYEMPSSSTSTNPQLSDDITYKKMIASKFGEETADEIQIIDIDVSKHLSQSNDWLKTISQEKDEQYKGEMPTSTARRKHQITYLAFQAKQREVELKNQWAANRLTKSQTRSKYGF